MSSSWPDATTQDLQHRIHAWMQIAPAGFSQMADHLPGCYNLSEQEFAEHQVSFESLALELFSYQYERVPPYRQWCDILRRSPRTVQTALQIPALPVEALRQQAVIGFPQSAVLASFRTSGTSAAGTGTLWLDDLELYDSALLRSFQHHVLPDRDSMRMLQLIPRATATPHSSLAYMVERVAQRWGAAGSDCFIDGEKLQVGALQKALRQCVADQEPVLLLGTAFAWVNFLDVCAEQAWRLDLPRGSRLFETGGYKGRSRAVSPTQLHQAFEHHLGIPSTHVVSEYGMTEMGSQYYTLQLRAALLGAEVPAARLWSFPMWLRPRLLHSESNRAQTTQQANAPGLLSHHDLANRGSVAHLLTADVGVPGGASFLLRGRTATADLRGCGLVQENLNLDGVA